MEFTRIILRPIHTEKTYTFAALEYKKYAFEVDTKASKHDIAIAFESIYGIHPVKIATQIRKPAKVRTGTAKPGYSKLMKLAYVTLPKGADIAASNTEAPKEATSKKTTSVKDVTKKEVTKKEITKNKTISEPKITSETYEELEKSASFKEAKKKLTADEVEKLHPSQQVIKADETRIELANGEIITKVDAAKDIQSGKRVLYIKNSGNILIGVRSGDGHLYVRAIPDDQESNNLENLPKITENGGK